MAVHPSLFLNLCFYLPALLIFLIIPAETGGKMTASKPILPKTVGLWTRPDSPRLVEAKNIFDYMDGAGELYLGYCFNHLEVYEYLAQSQKDIIVELYFMKSSDDAFGLLSLDWGGESVDLAPSSPEKAASALSTWPTALYGEGLLRLWSDNIYARVMAYQETPESKETVLALGRAIAKDRHNPPRPELLKSLPKSFQPNWTLRQDRASFFRTHLVLNSLYYLGQENMLDLDLISEAVTAPYERKDPSGSQTRLQFLLVRYADEKRARKALAHFHRDYLPEQPFPIKSGSSGKMMSVYPIEDGWLGYIWQEKTIAFIFECPDQETARTIIDQLR